MSGNRFCLLSFQVEEQSLTEGHAIISLGGIVSGDCLRFRDQYADGAWCYYAIKWGPYWEYGLGQLSYGSPDALTRYLVLDSSAGGQKLYLGPGRKLIHQALVPMGANANGVDTFADGDVTPSVRSGTVFICNNTNATLITDFDDWVFGHEIVILFMNGQTTLVHGTPIRHPGGSNITPTQNDVVTYVRAPYVGAVWQLVSWSQNA